jgi:hypothetical protein
MHEATEPTMVCHTGNRAVWYPLDPAGTPVSTMNHLRSLAGLKILCKMPSPDCRTTAPAPASPHPRIPSGRGEMRDLLRESQRIAVFTILGGPNRVATEEKKNTTSRSNTAVRLFRNSRERQNQITGPLVQPSGPRRARFRYPNRWCGDSRRRREGKILSATSHWTNRLGPAR